VVAVSAREGIVAILDHGVELLAASGGEEEGALVRGPRPDGSRRDEVGLAVLRGEIAVSAEVGSAPLELVPLLLQAAMPA